VIGYSAAKTTSKRIGFLAMLGIVAIAVCGMQPAAFASASSVTTLNDCSQQALVKAIDQGGTVRYGVDCSLNLAGPEGGNAITVPAGDTVDVEAGGHGVSFFNQAGVTPNSKGYRSFLVAGSLTLQGVQVYGATVRGAAGRAGQPGGVARGDIFYVVPSGRLELVSASVNNGTAAGGRGGDNTGAAGRDGASKGPAGSRARGGNAPTAGQGGSGGEADGGAIYNAGVTDLINCNFNGDQAVGGRAGSSAGGRGGSGGSSRARSARSFIGRAGGAGGAASNGGSGGAARGGAIFNAGTLTIVASSFVGDGALGGSGGSSSGGAGGSGGSGRIAGAGGPGGRSGPAGAGGAADGGVIFNSGAARIFDVTLTVSEANGGTGGSTHGGPGGRGGAGAAGAHGHPGGTGGKGGSAGQAHHAASGGEASGAAVSSSGTFAVAGAYFHGNSMQGGSGGMSVGAIGGDGGQGGRGGHARAGSAAFGGAGGNGGAGSSARASGAGGAADGAAISATGALSGIDSFATNDTALPGNGGARGSGGKGGHGAPGGRGFRRGLHGRAGHKGARAHHGRSGPGGGGNSAEVASIQTISTPAITVDFGHAKTRRSALPESGTAARFAADYLHPPAGPERLPAWLDLPRRYRNPLPAPAHASSGALPTFKGSFNTGDNTYHYTMVGASPLDGSHTTTVRVILVPLTVDFQGQEFNAASAAAALSQSPIFQNAPFTSGDTQYVDAMQRAEFWKLLDKKALGYHVLLAPPVVTSPVTFEVPWSLGLVAQMRNVMNGLTDAAGWDTALHQLVTRDLKASSNALVVAVTPTNRLFFAGGCCALGYHTVYKNGGSLNTAMWNDAPAAGEVDGIGANNELVISHEMAEWANDPYINNIVPWWTQPGTGNCFSPYLEVGDVIEALPNPTFPIALNGAVYHLQDVAGLSWFADAKPSTEQNGLYSYYGDLRSPAVYCQPS
jgi:hypothetical protein